MFLQENLVSAQGWYEKKQFVRLVELANNSNQQPVFPLILYINRNVNDNHLLYTLQGAEIVGSESFLALGPVTTIVSWLVLSVACLLAHHLYSQIDRWFIIFVVTYHVKAIKFRI